jgi:hypothetical protein
MTNITGFSQLSMHKIEYPNIAFALGPVPHDYSMPLPKLPKPYMLDSDSESENKKWPLHSETTPGQKNLIHPALVNKYKVYLSPINIKLAFIKIFVKLMAKERGEFAYLRKKIPKISEAKRKGVFVGPQVKQLLKDHDFSTKLNDTERRAWEESENV